MRTDLDALVPAPHRRVRHLLPARSAASQITVAEFIALAVAQMFLGVPTPREDHPRSFPGMAPTRPRQGVGNTPTLPERSRSQFCTRGLL